MLNQLQGDSPWYVVYTIPKHEKKVYGELNRRAIMAFLPLQKVTRQWRSAKRKVELPLFPNYLFVKITPSMLWSILSITGVVRFISYEGAPAVIKESEIEIIKKLISNNGELIDQGFYASGERVRVTQGPLDGLEGEIINIRGKDRLVVEFEVIHKVFAVDIPIAFLEKAV